MLETIFVPIWNYFKVVLTPLGLILLALVIWGEVKAYLTRKRVAVILDAKDERNEMLTEKTLDAVAGYSRLTNLLEKLMEKLSK